MLGQLRTRLADWLRYRETLAELSFRDPHILGDMGFERTDAEYRPQMRADGRRGPVRLRVGPGGHVNKSTKPELRHIDQTHVGEAEFGDDGQGDEHVLDQRIVHGAAALDHCEADGLGFLGDDLRPLVRHHAGDGQLDERQFPALANRRRSRRPTSWSRLAASAMSSRLVPMTIMWWLSWATVAGDAAIGVVAEARDEGVDHLAGAPVPLDDRDLRDVLTGVGLHEAILDRERPLEARVLVLFSIMPITRAVTAFFPAGAAIRKSAGSMVRPTLTVFSAKSG